jgi:tail tube protein
MAQPDVPRSRKLQVVMKPEATYGTDVLAGTYLAADIVPAMDITPSFDIEELEILATSGHLGRQLSALGMERGGVSFRMDLRGAGAAYSAGVKPEWHNPNQGCSLIGVLDATGGLEKYTYQPSDSPMAQTIYVVQHTTSTNAIAVKLVGCFGDVEYTIRAGQLVDARYTFQGLISNVDDITYVPGTITATPQYPVAKSALFQIGTENYAPRIADITVRLGNVLNPLQSINSVGGLAGYFIADRKPTVSMNPEGALEATYPWYTKWMASTVADCTFEAKGAGDYNRIQFSFARLQIIQQGWAPRDGLTAFPTTLQSTIASGNDDFTIVAAK